MTNAEMGVYIQAEARVTHADGTVEEVAPAETEAQTETEGAE